MHVHRRFCYSALSETLCSDDCDVSVAIAGVFAATSCILCDLRKQDDEYNYLWGGAVASTVFYFKGVLVCSFAIAEVEMWGLFLFETIFFGSAGFFADKRRPRIAFLSDTGRGILRFVCPRH